MKLGCFLFFITASLTAPLPDPANNAVGVAGEAIGDKVGVVIGEKIGAPVGKFIGNKIGDGLATAIGLSGQAEDAVAQAGTAIGEKV